MKTKFCVFNDRKIPMYLQVQGQPPERVGGYSTFNLLPQTSTVVTLEIPEGTVPYLKIWESGQALLSYID